MSLQLLPRRHFYYKQTSMMSYYYCLVIILLVRLVLDGKQSARGFFVSFLLFFSGVAQFCKYESITLTCILFIQNGMKEMMKLVSFPNFPLLCSILD